MDKRKRARANAHIELRVVSRRSYLLEFSDFVYFSDTYPSLEADNNDQKVAESQFDTKQWEIRDVSVLRALAYLNKYTSQGLDGIPAMVLKIFGKDARQQLASILNAILCGNEPLPPDWRRSRVES